MLTMTVLTNRIQGIGVTVYNSFATWIIEPFDYTSIILKDPKTPGYSATDRSFPKYRNESFLMILDTHSQCSVLYD